jgi:tetratricopeptide (TPR) repeat protein
VSDCAKTVKTHEPALKEMCERVLSFKEAYDDAAERIEDLAYYECTHGDAQSAVCQLERLAGFFEGFQNKSEEISSSLAQVYSLIGHICQYAGMFNESIGWINKSVVVDDQNPVSYHSLALSYQSIGDVVSALRSLEQEITVSPGNYYTYLLLADLYEKNKWFCEFEGVLKRLLERDPENIHGLHKLICFYERRSTHIDVEFLRRRLLNRTLNLNRIEAIIRAYHLWRIKNNQEAIEFLDSFSAAAPDVSIVHLANAHIYGHMHQYSRKRFELSLFKKKNHGREEIMKIKLKEFGLVFGNDAAQKIRKRLATVHPVSL